MLKFKYDTKADIPAQYVELYTEVNGVWMFTGIQGIKTQEDVDRVLEGARKEREDHAVTKAKLRKFGDLDADEVLKKLDRFDELEAAAANKIDDSKIEEIVGKRIKSITAPLERQITTLTAERDEAMTSVNDYKAKDVKRTIHDAVREAGTKAQIRTTAIADALLLSEVLFTQSEDGRVVAKDNVGITPGITPEVWFTEVKQTRPHWWPESMNAGAQGGNGKGSTSANPFSKANWNLTEQGRIIREDRNRAEMLAKSAGTIIGGGRPEK